ncbi:MAG TPA: hypothetical protein VH372_09645 [Actinospica sp.]|nr:hypothetical protein [Actinospica sp.]
MRTNRYVFPLTGAAALTLVAALGGCHGGGISAQAGRPQARVGQPEPATAATTAAAAAPATASPTRRCVTADLRIAPAKRQMKDGLDIERFNVTTSAAAGCALAGTLNLVPKGPLSAQEPDATVDLAVSQLPVPDSVGLAAGHGAVVSLLPGTAASFYLAWYSASSVVCVQSNGFGFNAPGDTTYADLQPLSFPVGSLCDGIFYVSALFQ